MFILLFCFITITFIFLKITQYKMPVKTRSTANKCLICYKIETYPKFFSCTTCKNKTHVCLDCLMQMQELRTSKYYDRRLATIGIYHDTVCFKCPTCRKLFQTFSITEPVSVTNSRLLMLMHITRTEEKEIGCLHCDHKLLFQVKNKFELKIFSLE